MRASRLLLFLTVITLFLGCNTGDSIFKMKESVLKQDLFTLRSSIDQYTRDKRKPPESLDELVSAGYLRVIPKDPITGNPDWVPVRSMATRGIVNVHSASATLARDGKPYSSW
jgi:general secretion pathway protein G